MYPRNIIYLKFTVNIVFKVHSVNPYTQLIFNYDIVEVRVQHRRRIYLENKVKVVASDWGTESLPR